MVRGHMLNLQGAVVTSINYVFEHQGPVTGAELLKEFPELRWKQLQIFLLALYNPGVLQVTKN